MNPDVIENHEILYRMVKRFYPDAFINGQPTPALFIDAKGASVDRDGGREEAAVIERFKWRFRKNNEYRTAVKITAAECREIDTYPIPSASNSNEFHAEIHESEHQVEISLLKAVKLAALCREVEH